jgi:hypothetical protein
MKINKCCRDTLARLIMALQYDCKCQDKCQPGAFGDKENELKQRMIISAIKSYPEKRATKTEIFKKTRTLETKERNRLLDNMVLSNTLSVEHEGYTSGCMRNAVYSVTDAKR